MANGPTVRTSSDVEQLIRNDATFRTAVSARGITDIETVRICALSAGCCDIPGEEGRRLVRGSSFVQSDPQDNAWAHPLEGLVAYLDLNTSEVIEVVDTDIVPVPRERFDYHLDSWLPEPRTTQKPIEISQPRATGVGSGASSPHHHGHTFDGSLAGMFITLGVIVLTLLLVACAVQAMTRKRPALIFECLGMATMLSVMQFLH